MWPLWSFTSTGIIDELLGHSGLTTDVPVSSNLFVSTLLIKEVANRNSQTGLAISQPPEPELIVQFEDSAMKDLCCRPTVQ